MAFPTTGLLDQFNRANEGPPPGAAWGGEVRPSWSSTQLKLLSNACVSNGGGGSNASNYFNTIYGPDSEVYMTLTALAENYERTFLFLRKTAADTVYMATFDAAPTNTVTITRVVATVETAIGSATAVTLAAGDTIGFEAIGTALKIYRKPSAGAWALIKSETDGGITGAGYAGIGTSGASAILDDFSGGTVIVPPPPYLGTMNLAPTQRMG
jgi:hypothetical protein